LRWRLRRLPARGRADAPPVSEDELIALTDAAAEADTIEDAERDMIASALALDRTVVREVMAPRADMVTVDAAATVTAALEVAISRGLSRLPVRRDNIDDIVGVVLLKDLARTERSGGGEGPVRESMRRAMFVPETKRVDELLSDAAYQGRTVRIAGAVDGESIDYDSERAIIRFEIVNIPNEYEDLATALREALLDKNARRLKIVVEDAAIPDLLQHEAQAILTGALGRDGVFAATELLLKCPSRFEESTAPEGLSRIPEHQ